MGYSLVGMGMGDMGGAAFDLGKEIAGTSPQVCEVMTIYITEGNQVRML